MDFHLIASAFDAMNIEPPARLTLLDARTLSAAHFFPAPPDIPALLYGFESDGLLPRVQDVLLSVYPKGHEITLLDGQTLTTARLESFHPSSFVLSPSSFLYLPPLGEGTSFESFAEITAHLRAPDGCPWDREQTHQTLRTHLLEESYEALTAMDENDDEAMREEFGDLLLQITLNAQIAHERGAFHVTEVIKHIHDKIVRRHPHVFGDLEVSGTDAVLANWEKLKEQERKKNKSEKGLLDGVPAALPALTQAQEYQDRAARVGFDWNEIEGVLDKIREEMEEVKAAENAEAVAEELGDLFFALVNLARWKKVDAESALRATNLKFKKRFGYVEQAAKKQGRTLSEMTLAEMDALWDDAKRAGLRGGR